MEHEPASSLRSSFDRAADRYHRARPRYPSAIFDRVEEACRSRAGGGPLAVLEIGPATGIATEVLASRGHAVTAVELGGNLAAAARRNLRDFPDVVVHHDDFETWTPSRWGSFDLVVAATSWHWLDVGRRYALARRHLRPGGILAFWSALHVVPDDGDPFFREIQPVYDEIGESLPDDWIFPRPGELPVHREEIVRSGKFDVELVEHHDWQITYDVAGYLELLDTFSGHISMETWKRDRLYRAIRDRLDQRPDRSLRRHWGCVLHIARTRDQ